MILNETIIVNYNIIIDSIIAITIKSKTIVNFYLKHKY